MSKLKVRFLSFFAVFRCTDRVFPVAAVDENLYYRSVSKSSVDHARLDQTHGVTADSSSPSLPSPSSDENLPSASQSSTAVGDAAQPQAQKSSAPPFLFRDAAQLLKMTQKHNVRCLLCSLSPLSFR
jgi:hypothetical protein